MKQWMTVVTVAAAMLVPLGAQAQTVNRVVSQYFLWDGKESQANNTATKVIYSHTFFVPSLSTGGPKYNVAYLSVHLTGEATCAGIDACASNAGLACTLDGTANANACPNGSAKTSAAGGLPYVILNSVNNALGEFASRDRNMSYTWCVPIKAAGTHTFRLFLASFLRNGGAFGSTSSSFVEGGMVNIDLAKLPLASACTAAPSL